MKKQIKTDTKNNTVAIKSIFELFKEALEILQLVQDINSLYSGIPEDGSRDCEYMGKVRQKYKLWRYDLSQAIFSKKLPVNEVANILKADGIQNLEGGDCYSDIQSQGSQDMLRRIKEETDKKINELNRLEEKYHFIKKEGINNQKITKIQIFEDENDERYKFIVSGQNVSRIVETSLNTQWAKDLYEIARIYQVEYSKNRLSNINSGKIKLYCKKFFSPTKIVKRINGKNRFMTKTNSVKIEKINSEKFYNIRKN